MSKQSKKVQKEQLVEVKPTKKELAEEKIRLQQERDALVEYFTLVVRENHLSVIPKICLEEPHLMRNLKTTHYSSTTPLVDAEVKMRHASTPIEIRHSDTILAAIDMKKKGFTVGAVNNANGFHAGGSYLDYNLFPQEENLLARSLLSASLYDIGGIHGQKLYPVGASGVIVTEDAVVFRDDKFRMLDRSQWESINFLSAAGLDLRELIENYQIKFHEAFEKFLNDLGAYKEANPTKKVPRRGGAKKKSGGGDSPLKDDPNAPKPPLPPLEGDELIAFLYDDNAKLYMIEVIRSILRAAVRHGIDCPILGALGCGIFANPPEIVANLFKQTLAEPEFQGVFRHVVFAITNGAGKPCPNYEVFAKVFGQPIAAAASTTKSSDDMMD
jgi:hypothetical protein